MYGDTIQTHLTALRVLLKCVSCYNPKMNYITNECILHLLYAYVPDKPPGWDIPHVSETFDCSGCFAFSAADICSHSRSDHNFYAVCQVRMNQAL
jgi:hypothetical protein